MFWSFNVFLESGMLFEQFTIGARQLKFSSKVNAIQKQ
jgi:hypothetical protein